MCPKHPNPAPSSLAQTTIDLQAMASGNGCTEAQAERDHLYRCKCIQDHWAAFEGAANSRATKESLRESLAGAAATKEVYAQLRGHHTATHFNEQLLFTPVHDENAVPGNMAPLPHGLGSAPDANDGCGPYADDPWTPATLQPGDLVSRLSTTDKVLKNENDIFKNTENYFQWKFREKRIHVPSRRKVMRAMRRRRLSKSDQLDLARPYDTKEFKRAMAALGLVSPGGCGTPPEFLRDVGDDMAPILARVANSSVACGAQPLIMREGLITLAYKGGGKDHRDLKSYRPIGGISVYAKALSGAMAHRMTWAMGKIVPVSQQAMLPGRAMINNIYTIDGVMHHTALANGGATRAADDPRGSDPLLYEADQAGAYDNAEPKILYRMMDIAHGQSPGDDDLDGTDYEHGKANMHRAPFVRHLCALLTDRVRAVCLNGFITAFFAAAASLTQGCSVAVQTFLLIMAALGAMFAIHVPGLRMPDGSTLSPMCLFADDSIGIQQSRWGALALDIMAVFCGGTGQNSSAPKSALAFLGPARSVNVCWRPTAESTPGGTVRDFSTPSMRPGEDAPGPAAPRCLCRPPGAKFRLLGIHFGYGVSQSAQWDAVGKAIYTAMHAWTTVRTTQLGRSHCVKTVAWSKLWFIGLVRQAPPALVATLWATAKYFVWHKRMPPGCTHETPASLISMVGIPPDYVLARPMDAGGLSLTHPDHQLKAQSAGQVRRLLVPPPYYEPVDPKWATWRTLPRHQLREYLRSKLGPHADLDAMVWAPARLIRPGPATALLSPIWRLAISNFLDVREACKIQPAMTREHAMATPLAAISIGPAARDRLGDAGISTIRHAWSVRHGCWAHLVPGLSSTTTVLGARRQDWFALASAAVHLQHLLQLPVKPISPGEWVVDSIGAPRAVFRYPRGAPSLRTGQVEVACERWLPWRGAWRLDLTGTTDLRVDALKRADVSTRSTQAGVAVQIVFGAMDRVWAGGLNRIRYKGSTLACVKTRVMRQALQATAYCVAGRVFTGPTARASKVARVLDWDMGLPWRAMWSAGWAAAWPPEVREYWWTLTSGTRYFAGARRAFDPASSGCKLCEATYGRSHAADTLDHMVACPVYSQLWDSVAAVLILIGVRTAPANVLRTLLYGVGYARPADAVTLIRGAAIAAVRSTRNQSLSAAANGGMVRIRPSTIVRTFRDEVRRHVQLDYCVATGAHRLPTTPQHGANLQLPLRPLSRSAFAVKWHGVVSLRRAGRVRHYKTIFERHLVPPMQDDV